MCRICLCAFHEMFKLGKLLTRGSYCRIHEVCDHPEKVAKVYIRPVRDASSPIDLIEDVVLREIGILRLLSSHPHVVTLTDLAIVKNDIMLVLERCEGCLDADKVTDVDIRKKITRHVLEALGAMHRLGIMHRDIKPDNILLTRSGDVRLCDFNLSIQRGLDIATDAQYEVDASTRWWRAPEVLLADKVYNCSVDVWSIGVILLTMRVGYNPLRGDSDIGQLFATFKLIGTPGRGDRWPKAADLPHWKAMYPQYATGDLETLLSDDSESDLIRHMVAYPTTRKSAAWLLEHPYFSD